MSSYAIIQDTSHELRRRIFGALASAPDADFGLSSPEEDITFSLPSADLQGNPRLSLYLYRIEPDGHLRNQYPLADGAAGLRRPPLTVQLHYLVTPLDEDDDTNHLIVGCILQHFHDEPFLSSINGTPLGTSFGGASDRLSVVLEPISTEELSRIWSVNDGGFRLSIGYLVRTVAIDSATGITDARRVVDAHIAVGVKS